MGPGGSLYVARAGRPSYLKKRLPPALLSSPPAAHTTSEGTAPPQIAVPGQQQAPAEHRRRGSSQLSSCEGPPDGLCPFQLTAGRSQHPQETRRLPESTARASSKLPLASL